MNILVHKYKSDHVTELQCMFDNGLGFCKIHGWDEDKYPEQKDRLFISSLSVSEEAREQGLGRKIITSFEQFAKEKEYKECWLFADKNNWVFDWYKRMGYKEAQKYKEGGIEGEDNYWMKKILKY